MIVNDHELSLFDEISLSLIEKATFKFAKTMAHYNPHHYTLRDTWFSHDEFFYAVRLIRRIGEVETYGNKQYTCLNINGFKYWTMGAPVGETILINRKPLVGKATADF